MGMRRGGFGRKEGDERDERGCGGERGGGEGGWGWEDGITLLFSRSRPRGTCSSAERGCGTNPDPLANQNTRKTPSNLPARTQNRGSETVFCAFLSFSLHGSNFSSLSLVGEWKVWGERR